MRRLGRLFASAQQLDACLTGSRLAKDRAAEALTKVMIPEALDYPMSAGVENGTDAIERST